MPSTTRRAVITGLGVLSPVGSDPTSFWQSLRAGASGIRTIQHFDASSLPNHIAGELPSFEPKTFFTKAQRDSLRSLNKMAKAVQLGFCASAKAWEDAGGPKKGEIDPFRYGVEFACVMVSTDLEDLSRASQVSADSTPGSINLDKWGREGLNQVPPQWMLKYLPNMPACHSSILVDAQGPNNTITSGDAAGITALGEAFRILSRDQADAFLVGGCESKIHPLSFTRHNIFLPLSRKNDTPTEALRPFDRLRDGTVLGEGAAVYGLEELSFAQARGARIYAELVGFACGFDRGLKGSVLATVIRRALAEAGATPDQVDHVNAAAAGFPELDAFEARAIHEVFGHTVPVYAPTAHFGHMGAATGLVELAGSILALHHGELPGTLNYTNPDPACPITVHTGDPRPISKPYAVKLSYTNMGHCAAVVIKRWDHA